MPTTPLLHLPILPAIPTATCLIKRSRDAVYLHETIPGAKITSSHEHLLDFILPV